MKLYRETWIFLIVMIFSTSLAIFGLIGEKDKYDSKIDDLQHQIDSMNQTMSKYAEEIWALNNTLNQVDMRTTTNNPVIYSGYGKQDPLSNSISHCIDQQGYHSPICQAEMKINPIEFYNGAVIQGEHEYTFSTDNKSWCYMRMDLKEDTFIIDLNSTQYTKKCNTLWSSMK